MSGVGPFCRVLAAIVVSVGFSIPVATASAKVEPGVHVDPGSPAGKEYQLPLDQARHDNSGGVVAGGTGGGPGGGAPGGGDTGAGGSAGTSSAPLFGVGITPASARRNGAVGSAGHGKPGDRRRNDASDAHGTGGAKTGAAGATSGVTTAGSYPRPAQVLSRNGGGGGSTGTVLTLVVVGGLILFALAGLALRRAGGPGQPA